VEARDDFRFEDAIEASKVDDHAGLVIDVARHGDFATVVMPVTLGVGTLAEPPAVLVVAPVGTVIAV
jgi:hypothetical protein